MKSTVADKYFKMAKETKFRAGAVELAATFASLTTLDEVAGQTILGYQRILADLKSHMVKKPVLPPSNARTSLLAQVHDKSGSGDPSLGSDCTHP